MNESLIQQAEVEALAARCYRSPVEFARVFLPDWFPTKMPWVHRGMLALMKNRTEFLLDFGTEEWRDETAEWTHGDLEKVLTNFLEEGTLRPIFKLEIDETGEPRLTIDAKSSVCIIMPRGSSKTTLVNLDNLHDIVYQEEDFFLYVSESGAHAERQLGTIKHELEDNDGAPSNELLSLVFGLHKPSRQSPLKWTENYIETLKGVMVGAVGRGGQVRGFGKRAKRPGKIMFDDLEDEESVLSDTQRKKDAHWFFNAARPAKRKKGGRDIVTGTLLHTDAILNKCVKHPEFTAVRFGAIDRQGDPLWEWWMTLEEIEASRQAAASVGELSGWYLEYMSEYKDDDARMFPENKIIYVSKAIERFVAMSLALDPALADEKRKGDLCAFAVAGIENGGQKHIIDYYGQVGMDPTDIIEKFFDLHFKWMKHLPIENQKHGIEAIAFQRALIPLVRMKQVEYSRPHKRNDGTTHVGWGQSAYFEVEPLFHGKIAKPVRIKGILKPLIWSGHLTFEREFPSEGAAPGLHTQLIDFPNSKFKDGPDVCAMAVALLDPYVALGLGEEGIADLEKDTLPPLPLYGGAP